MAIDLNISTQSTVSDNSPRTVSPLLETDVNKVAPTGQGKVTSVREKPSPDISSSNPPSIEISKKELKTVVSKLNEFVEEQKRGIRFSIDEDTNRTVVKLLDANGEVLKQFPSEDALAILKGIEKNIGLFLEYKV